MITVTILGNLHMMLRHGSQHVGETVVGTEVHWRRDGKILAEKRDVN